VATNTFGQKGASFFAKAMAKWLGQDGTAIDSRLSSARLIAQTNLNFIDSIRGPGAKEPFASFSPFPSPWQKDCVPSAFDPQFLAPFLICQIVF